MAVSPTAHETPAPPSQRGKMGKMGKAGGRFRVRRVENLAGLICLLWESRA
jgi:hypothetical protein